MKLFMMTFIIIILLGCKEDKADIRPPIRHKNIPTEAFWHGHVDGGQWYHCQKSNDIYSFYCTVYNENTGQIVISDKFTIFVENNKNQMPLSEFLAKGELKNNNIIGFNGYDMGLKLNLVLVPSNNLVDD